MSDQETLDEFLDFVFEVLAAAVSVSLGTNGKTGLISRLSS